MFKWFYVDERVFELYIIEMVGNICFDVKFYFFVYINNLVEWVLLIKWCVFVDGYYVF